MTAARTDMSIQPSVREVFHWMPVVIRPPRIVILSRRLPIRLAS